MTQEQQEIAEAAAGCVMAFIVTAASLIVGIAILLIFIIKAN
jgi:biopolymer transport protein ExbB/TolQ